MFSRSIFPIVEAVRQAADMSLEIDVSTSCQKRDLSPVTIADYAVQASITNSLLKIDTTTPLVAEEDQESLNLSDEFKTEVLNVLRPTISDINPGKLNDLIAYSTHETCARYWTLDPIDGTKGFLRQANYAIALGLVENNIVTEGVLACPRLVIGEYQGVILAATREQGCWMQDLAGRSRWKQVRVSERSQPSQARILHSYEAAHTNLPEIEAMRKSMNVSVDGVGIDSQAKYALLAAGEGELIFRLPNTKNPNYREKIWDHAAGMLCLQEAGGKVTDALGKPLDFSTGFSLLNNRGVLASNNHLHDTALEAIRKFSRTVPPNS